MITVEMVCTGKNARLEGENVITDVTFQPPQPPAPTHAMGAQIGVPDPSIENEINLPKPVKPSYNLMSGALSVSVLDAKEADKYSVGTTYQLAVGAAPKKKDE